MRVEPFPSVGFIVANLALPSRAVVQFYNKWRTAEQWIKEGKLAVNWTRLSCHWFRGSEVAFWQYLAKGRGTSVAERVANQERPRTERGGIIIPWGGVPASSQVTGQSGQQNRESCACPATAARAGPFEVDARARQAYGFAQNGVEIGNSD